MANHLTGDYALDSRLTFTAQQMGSKVHGCFGRSEGTAHLDGEDPSSSHVELAIQTSSIDTGNPRRDEHLRRSFLKTGSHPLATFTSTEITRLDESKFTVTGVLTLRGVTKPVTFDLRLSENLRFQGELTLDRRDWNVIWNPVAEGGGVFVGYAVSVHLDVVATPSGHPADAGRSGPVGAGLETEA